METKKEQSFKIESVVTSGRHSSKVNIMRNEDCQVGR